MEVRAKLRFLKISPPKVRLVVDIVRGLPISEAEAQLQFMNKKAALPVLKLIRSAAANAENNHKLKKEDLYIKRIMVDQGPTLHRWRPRAYGRAAPIRKRSSHVTVIVEDRPGTGEKDSKDTKGKTVLSTKSTTKASVKGAKKPAVKKTEKKDTKKKKVSSDSSKKAKKK